MKMSRKVLIVDNDFFFVEFLTELLENRGYEVIKAYDGKEGLERFDENQFDLIFCDIIMPKIDGGLFINIIRKRYPDASFPIIALSDLIIEQLGGVKKMKADYFIPKGPMEEMGKELETLLDRIERDPLPFQDKEEFFERDNLYPRQASVELMESLNFQKSIIESIGVGIVVVDKDAKVIGANGPALEILKKSMEQVLNNKINNVFPESCKAKLVRSLKQVIQNQDVRNSAFAFEYKDKNIGVIVSVLRLEGEIAGWTITMEDTEWAEQA